MSKINCQHFIIWHGFFVNELKLFIDNRNRLYDEGNICEKRSLKILRKRGQSERIPLNTMLRWTRCNIELTFLLLCAAYNVLHSLVVQR